MVEAAAVSTLLLLDLLLAAVLRGLVPLNRLDVYPRALQGRAQALIDPKQQDTNAKLDAVADNNRINPNKEHFAAGSSKAKFAENSMR